MYACAQSTEPRTYYGPVIRICKTLSSDALIVRPDLLDRPIGKPGDLLPHLDYPVDDDGITTIRAAMDSNPALSVFDFLPDIRDIRKAKENAYFLRELPVRDKLKIGNPAIYSLFITLYHDPQFFGLQQTLPLKAVADYAKHSYAFAATGSYDNIEASLKRGQSYTPDHQESTCIRTAYEVGRVFSLCARNSCKKKQRTFLREAKDYAGGSSAKYPRSVWATRKELDCTAAAESRYKVFRIDGLLFLHIAKQKTSFILSKKDIGDVQRLLHQVAIFKGYNRAYSRELADDETRLLYSDACKGTLERLLEVCQIASTSGQAANQVGEYFKIFVDHIDADNAGRVYVDNPARVAQKFAEKGLAVFPSYEARSFKERLQRLPLKEQLELADVTKFSCYPEYCPFEAGAKQAGLYSEARSTGGPEGSDIELRYQDLMSYRRWRRISRVRLLTGSGVYPGTLREGRVYKPWHLDYKMKGIPEESYADSHDVDLTGVVHYFVANESALLRQKDVSLAPSEAKYFEDEETLRRAPRDQRNALRFVLERSHPQTIEQTLNQSARGEKSYLVLTGQRLERGKRYPRLFFQHDVENRMSLSNLELNVEPELKVEEGNMLGTFQISKQLNLNKVASADAPGEYVIKESTDLEKFSIKMSRRIHQDVAAEYAEMYGRPELAHVYDCMTEATIHIRAYGYLLKMKPNGANFEGMNGKSNTLLHADIRGYTHFKCRTAGLIAPKKTELVFIDDAAAAKYLMPEPRNLQRAKEVAELVTIESNKNYECTSWKQSYDKSYQSVRYYIMLSERFMDRNPLRQGLKAALSFADKIEPPVEDFSTISNGALAVASGVASNSGPLEWATYYYHFSTLLGALRLMPQLLNEIRSTDYGLLAVTPTRLGGLGLVGSLGLEANVVGPSAAMGITILDKMATSIPSIAENINNLLNGPLEEIGSLVWLRQCDYAAVRGPRLRSMRVKSKCIKAAMARIANPWLKAILTRVDMEEIMETAERFRALDIVCKVTVDEYWASTTLCQVEGVLGKFQQAEEMTKLLSPNEVYSLRRAARRDLTEVVRSFVPRAEGEYPR
jgi:hypothetical protein